MRHGPVPIRNRNPWADILKRLLELIKIDSMPRQETFPPVLAMVLMNQSHVVITAPILGPLVEVIELSESPAQPVDLRLGHTVEVCALLELAILVSVFVRRALQDLEAADRRFNIPLVDLLERGCCQGSFSVE